MSKSTDAMTSENRRQIVHRTRARLRCEADGVKLENCAPYIREWIEREKD